MARVFVVYDNSARGDFVPDWGFSCFVEADYSLLFDTGADPEILEYNLSLAGLDDFDYVFLSHEHYDHIGGLGAVLDRTSCVVVPKSFSRRLKEMIKSKAELMEIERAVRIAEHMYSTGELGTFIKEQSLIVEGSKGCLVITGCSHPGLDRILRKANEIRRISAVAGGFHGFGRIEILRSYDLVAPCHCTVYKQEILRFENAVECCAGCGFEF